MMRRTLLISLIDPVITTADASTASAPEALPYIPGSMLHGLAASQGYRDPAFSGETFRMFHDGAVRFGDGLPVDPDGAVGFPAPMSLQTVKGESPVPENLENSDTPLYLAESVEDFAVRERDDQQWKSLGSRAFSFDRKFIAVRSSTTTRTAIDPDSGRAADSQLFSYEALDAGQRFVTTIEADSQDDLMRIIPLLAGERILGRSKSAEFGRVKIEEIEATFEPSAQKLTSEKLYIWMLSDLWAQGSSGQPSVRPDPKCMGFGDAARIDWDRSFVLNRRISPFNAYWKMRGLEREVIQRGSVLTIIDPGPDQLCGMRSFGFGTELGCGLAMVGSEPPLEMLKQMTHRVGVVQDKKKQVSPSPETALSAWLTRRVGSPEVRVTPQELADDLYSRYADAKRWHGKAVGPTPSQWGALRTILEVGGDVSSVIGEADARSEREAWNARFADGPGGTFSGWVRAKLEDRAVSTAVLATAARNVRDRLKREPANG